MPKASKSSGRTSRSDVEAGIVQLKKEVRRKVTRGQALSKSRNLSDLEAREIQIKIADLETKAAKAESLDRKKTSPIATQKVRRQTHALKRKLDI